ncbi:MULTISPECIES: hypothetical protein [Limosilactobacillus]|uniref:hypothetical protein n=1 Tax=Limosilactobacillus TaxID=2742598 RepID=UPI00242D6A74|nr:MULTISPECIES: hypothetical protein [Limosilactobacillus]MCI6852621.1 hypothetical protein [Limosilactobacillus vaginalis]MDY4864869.1 hypothetical protein [Limosilactobacillus sp.]
MKKIGLICAVALAGMSLAACGNQSSKKASSSSKVSSSKVVKSHKKQNKKKQNTSSSNATSTSSEKASNQAQQQNSQSNTSHASQQANGINNAQDALNAAKAKYGDGNGNYHWTVMYDAGTGQPIRNADGSYFVKAIDPTQGTMTGTAQSVNVYPDGSMTNN